MLKKRWTSVKPQTELSPRGKKIAEFLALLIVSVITCAIVIIISLGVAAWYKQLF